MLRHLASALLLCSLSATADAQLLYNNGGIQTGTANGANGQNTSAIGVDPVSGVSGGTFGLGAGSGNRLADDFTVPAGQSWTVSGVSILAYVTGAYAFPPVSPFAGLSISIRDLAPSNPLSTIIATSSTLLSNTFTGIYRVNTDPLNGDRPVFELQVDFGGLNLAAGTYWIDFAYAAGFTPPVTTFDPIDNRPELVPGNAEQFTTTSGVWQTVVNGSLTPVTIPFSVNGTNVTAVPEPGTWLAAGLCLGGLAWNQRRRFRAAR